MTNEAGTVVSDASKLERILLNLVENAAKYAPDERIELHAARVGAEVGLSVVDHGPGIPEADRERVFERFIQLDQSSTRRQGGTGLGLHLCRQLADLVDGRTTLDETPGGGCTFTLWIPGDTSDAGERSGVGGLEPMASAGVDAPGAADEAGGGFPFGTVRARPTGLAVPCHEPAR